MLPETKLCPKCNIEKSSDQYHTRTDTKKGYKYLKSYCKECCKQRPVKVCTCGKKMDSRSNSCRKCVSKNAEQKTIGYYYDLYKDKYDTNRAYQAIRSRIRGQYIRSGNKRICQNCAYDKHVEICHIKPIHSFDKNTLIDNVNSPENLAYLCPNCHWELDNGLLNLGV